MREAADQRTSVRAPGALVRLPTAACHSSRSSASPAGLAIGALGPTTRASASWEGPVGCSTDASMLRMSSMSARIRAASITAGSYCFMYPSRIAGTPRSGTAAMIRSTSAVV
ncbi:hypothetical protein [Phytohabitans flavus]|uniref:hypothetical protein n=1 Tax=Phytohabitans flavus TaxID=1076124 RepID=UPI001E59AF9D|nr:hypothetical protein [Phytohabitans flavus]